MVAEEASRLFSLIADNVKIFLEDHHPDRLKAGQILNLGFCFAFPVNQTSVNSGNLIRWTKGFDIDDAVGKDVCQLLQKELDELGLPVKITAMVNDALGTAMTRAFTLPISKTRACMGAIFSTGTNGVYLEQLSNITKDIGKHDKTTGEMFLSTEWGSLDNKLKVLPSTEYDEEIDNASINKGNQMFEKRVSGGSLGELLRLAIEKLYDNPRGGLFPNYRRGDRSLLLRDRWSVDASILSVAESDDSRNLNELKKKVETTFGLPGWAVTLQDTKAIQNIARAIATRAARLAGTAVGAVIYQSGKLEHVDSVILPERGARLNNPDSQNDSEIKEETRVVDIGVDGSVFELYPRFEEYMREALRAIDKIGPDGEQRVRIGLAKDGSSIGTAIIALLAAQQKDDGGE